MELTKTDFLLVISLILLVFTFIVFPLISITLSILLTIILLLITKEETKKIIIPLIFALIVNVYTIIDENYISLAEAELHMIEAYVDYPSEEENIQFESEGSMIFLVQGCNYRSLTSIKGSDLDTSQYISSLVTTQFLPPLKNKCNNCKTYTLVLKNKKNKDIEGIQIRGKVSESILHVTPLDPIVSGRMINLNEEGAFFIDLERLEKKEKLKLYALDVNENALVRDISCKVIGQKGNCRVIRTSFINTNILTNTTFHLKLVDRDIEIPEINKSKLEAFVLIPGDNRYNDKFSPLSGEYYHPNISCVMID